MFDWQYSVDISFRIGSNKAEKRGLAWRQASEESARYLLSSFSVDKKLQAYLFFIVTSHKPTRFHSYKPRIYFS